MKQNINVNLEALRGYAALFVVFGHLVALSWMFNPQFTPSFLVVFSPSSHLFLLVFFVLSGYVITSSNKGINNTADIKDYLIKRLLRIYPIYFMALIITLIIAGFHYPFSRIFWNFALMQDLMAPQFVENGPTWSLHFEMLFYLLFIPLVLFKTNYLIVFILSIVVALANFYFYPNMHTPIVSAYLFGFAFWMGGACIAEYLPTEQTNVPYNKLIGALLMILAVDQMVFKSGLTEVPNNVAFGLFNQHLIYPAGIDGSKIVLGYQDLAFIPYCLFTVLIYSGRKYKYQKLAYVILLLPLLYSIFVFLTEAHKTHYLAFIAPISYFTLSILVLFFNGRLITKAGRLLISIGAWLGAISYGIYIIHAPLLYLFGKFNITNHLLLNYLIKLGLLMAVIIGVSYLLEKVYQPWIRSVFTRRKKDQAVKL